uniref:NIPSNAP domain-containing protein n=1 Tax=Podarcis muralis TaxID=64176 RepID=A0A670K0B1_PODMU
MCQQRNLQTAFLRPRQDDGTFYEFRTYTQNIHLRTAHSQMVGYWTSEFGGLNKSFPYLEIWYANHWPRTKNGKKNTCLGMLPLLEKQDNEIAYLVPWCELGVYELVTFQMKPGGPAVWGQSFKAAISIHIKTGYTKLIGVFHTEYGLLNRVHVLWWNENSDCRAAGRHSAHEDPRVVAAVRESVQFLESQQNCLLVPKQFSPLK